MHLFATVAFNITVQKPERQQQGNGQSTTAETTKEKKTIMAFIKSNRRALDDSEKTQGNQLNRVDDEVKKLESKRRAMKSYIASQLGDLDGLAGKLEGPSKLRESLPSCCYFSA